MIGNIFSLKSQIVDKKGNVVLDLWQQSIKWITDKLKIESTLMVTDKFKMRPDLIAQAAWGDPGSADILMKFNHISNPFSIDEGNVIIVPQYEQMINQLYVPDSSASQNITTVVPTTIKFKNIQKKAYNARNTPISNNSPNQAEPGDKEMKFLNGQIIFGPSVANNSDNSNVPLAKAALIDKLTSNALTKTS